MRMRFRAETKDVVIFLIFAILWLVIISLTVANVSAFLNEESFTLNFLLGFTAENIAATLVLFFVGIVAVFAGVKSFFLEKEDDQFGVGISIGQKKEKNYARWSRPAEIKKSLNVKAVDPLAPKANAAGIPLIMKPNKVWVDDGG